MKKKLYSGAYNRQKADVKCMHEMYFKALPKDVRVNDRGIERSSRLFPDIIVHRRCSYDNLLAIEMKLNGCDKEYKSWDCAKLQYYTSQDGSLEYQLGAWILLRNGKSPRIKTVEYYVNGQLDSSL